MIERKVIRYIEEQQMFTRQSRIIVALSGGADSVALLCILLRLGYSCEAAHCNFHLRGEESIRDQSFVEELTRKLGVPLHLVHFDTKAYAFQKGISIEMAARELRYDWFEKLRKQRKADVIAVAHHRDDSVETFLLNLIRGTGINGLRGIQPVNGVIVRPLLNISRYEILDYLSAINQPYVTDSTNLTGDYTRNKIRLNIIPLLEEINPSVSTAIADTAGRLGEVAKIYHDAMKEACHRVCIDEHRISVTALLKEVSPKSVLYELLYPIGFNPSQINDIFDTLGKQSGKRFYAEDKVLLYNRDELIWQEKNATSTLPLLCKEFTDRSVMKDIPDDTTIACLDADSINEDLVIRKWQSGDRFVPLGMTGFKKVRNYLLDKKFSLFQKENQYVVCSGSDIVWLVGERIDNRFRVRPETQRIVILRVKNAT